MLSVPKVIERGGLTRKPEASDSIPSGRARRGQSKERSALCTSQSGSAGLMQGVRQRLQQDEAGRDINGDR